VTRRAALALLVAVALAGCGAGSLSAVQLRTAATRVCSAAGRRLNRIRTPARPAQGAAFLSRGIAALRPELAALGRLRPSGGMAGALDRGRAATAKMLNVLESTLKGLKKKLRPGRRLLPPDRAGRLRASRAARTEMPRAC
jgi:hypothetical protein